MIVIDVNLLIYAYDTTCPEHEQAREWLENIFSGDDSIGLPWQSISAFIRILSDPGPGGKHVPLTAVLAIVDGWLKLPNAEPLAPGERHWAHFRDVLVRGDARGRLTTDAALAAITMEYGGVLYTNDRDFARFPGLRWINPLVGP